MAIRMKSWKSRETKRAVQGLNLEAWVAWYWASWESGFPLPQREGLCQNLASYLSWGSLVPQASDNCASWDPSKNPHLNLDSRTLSPNVYPHPIQSCSHTCLTKAMSKWQWGCASAGVQPHGASSCALATSLRDVENRRVHLLKSCQGFPPPSEVRWCCWSLCFTKTNPNFLLQILCFLYCLRPLHFMETRRVHIYSALY